MLSRLKGIETHSFVRKSSFAHSLWICFPVWRELKRNGTHHHQWHHHLWICFPVWRELKQNWYAWGWSSIIKIFGYAFPFEGNWNLKENWAPFPHIPLWICFPVWRELKRVRMNFDTNILQTFGYAFPFEGNWNFTDTFKARGHLVFGYAFPFEGNWNFFSRQRSCAESSALSTLDMLSRLKGIETSHTPGNINSRRLWICFPVWRELKRYVGCAKQWHNPLWICFPVWRELKQSLSQSHSLKASCLWICFPVWRELKPGGSIAPSPSFRLWICFPVLKGIETIGWYQSIGVQTSFGYAFPFEGNWNNTRST